MGADLSPVSQVRESGRYMVEPTNPFNITRAVDFSNEQIIRTFVDLPGGGFASLASPTSSMPMFLLGGKGSGRTHLMRYFSYPVQKLRYGTDIGSGLHEEGYIGIYLRCGGLNAGRFNGKGQTQDVWETVFPYYMDLWLAQLTLATVADAFGRSAPLKRGGHAAAQDLLTLFEVGDSVGVNSLGQARDFLHALQRELDVAVNNAAITRKLEVVIRITRGVLPFRLPQLLAKWVPQFRGLSVLYLIDELENLSEAQQEYVNTLVREREDPSTLKIGTRRYGLRTLRTYAAGEENREGSEFEKVYLDLHYIENEEQYDAFVRSMVARRIAESRAGDLNAEQIRAGLDACFEEPPRDRFLESELEFLLPVPSVDRAHFQRLLGNLAEARVPRERSDAIATTLTCSELPLLEKINVFLLYQDWYSRKDLLESAHQIGLEAEKFRAGQKAERHENALEKFKFDLFAQLLRENGKPQQYLGLDTFIHMSCGLPRNLLIILKHIYKWAMFYGQEPFGRTPLGREAQHAGVLEAAKWFYGDAQVLGPNGRNVQEAIARLGTFFRRLRFVDKPVETSLITFSTDKAKLTERARTVLDLAEQWSLLIEVSGGQRDRNSEAVNSKYQLSGMLSPHWDLPIYRRGTIALTDREVNAIFDPDLALEFDLIMQRRLSRMNAPFGAEGGPQGTFAWSVE